MPVIVQSCETCHYFKYETGSVRHADGNYYGRCKYNAPLPSLDDEGQARWPMVKSVEDWCGQYVQKDDG